MRLSQRKVTTTLRQHGYELTPQRRAVIQAIASTQDHLTPTAIYDKVHQDHPDIGLVTIYRTLETLVKLKLICELHAGGSCHSYTISAPGHHHHLICSNCGRVIDFTSSNLSGLEKRLSQDTGFKMEGHLLEFLGLCPDCQKEEAECLGE